jgi:hypothetical protein
VFESSSHPLSALESTLRDEELYENYLAARAEQANLAARTADENLAGDATNPDLASTAILAKEVAISIDRDLAEQRIKLANIRGTLQEMGSAEGQDLPIIPNIAPVTPQRPILPADSTAKTSTWSATTTQKAAAVLAKLKTAKARETIARARQIAAAARAEKQVAAKNPPPQKNSAPKYTPSKVSPPAFRQEQTARAEKITQAHQAAESKVCPNCTSSVPQGTTRCRCGFGFESTDREMPSLTLCTGDFTALRDSLKLNLR